MELLIPKNLKIKIKIKNDIKKHLVRFLTIKSLIL